MKNIISVAATMAALTLSTQSFARTFICESESGFFGKEHRIVMNDKENKAMILTRSGEKLELNYEKAQVQSNRWGFNVHASEMINVDWSAPENQNRCFVWGKHNMNFSLETEEEIGQNGEFKGTLFISPNFIVKPNVRCRLPHLALPAPVSLKCKLY